MLNYTYIVLSIVYLDERPMKANMIEVDLGSCVSNRRNTRTSAADDLDAPVETGLKLFNSDFQKEEEEKQMMKDLGLWDMSWFPGCFQVFFSI